MFFQTKRLYLIKGEFPLDVDGRPTDKTACRGFFNKFFPRVAEEWVRLGKKADFVSFI